MNGALRINLGCHYWKLDGFINIDIDPTYADVVADALHLPYEENSVDEIYAGHILEHFSLHEEPLREWHRVLKPGGVITVTVPDIEKGLLDLRAGLIDLDWFHRIVFGSTERAEQVHHQVFTVDLLLTRMRGYFPDTVIIPWCPYLVAPVTWQTIARGTKPETCVEVSVFANDVSVP